MVSETKMVSQSVAVDPTCPVCRKPFAGVMRWKVGDQEFCEKCYNEVIWPKRKSRMNGDMSPKATRLSVLEKNYAAMRASRVDRDNARHESDDAHKELAELVDNMQAIRKMSVWRRLLWCFWPRMNLEK